MTQLKNKVKKRDKEHEGVPFTHEINVLSYRSQFIELIYLDGLIVMNALHKEMSASSIWVKS